MQHPKIPPNSIVNGLKVIRVVKTSNGNQGALYEYECHCGAIKQTLLKNLRKKTTKFCNCKVGLRYDDISVRQLHWRYRFGCKKREMDFELSLQVFETFLKKDCFYCGKGPSQVYNYRNSKNEKLHEYTYNGIDRLNNSLGYSLSNCVTCCWECNQKKSDQNLAEFASWVKTCYDILRVKGII